MGKDLGAPTTGAGRLMRYNTDRWSYEIRPVEITRESGEYVFLPSKSIYAKKSERREAKHSDYGRYHATEAEAVEYLISRARTAMEAAKAETHRLNTALGQLESRKKKMTAQSAPKPPADGPNPPVTPEDPKEDNQP